METLAGTLFVAFVPSMRLSGVGFGVASPVAVAVVPLTRGISPRASLVDILLKPV